MNAIVCKVHEQPETTAFTITPFTKPRPGERLHFEVSISAKAEDGMLKSARVSSTALGFSPFSIICDEGTGIGGGDSAPAPLDYFVAGIAFCLLTHLTMFIRLNKINVADIKIEQRMKFSVMPNDPMGLNGTSDGLETHILIDSEEPQEIIIQMFQEVTTACFALQSIIKPIPVEAHLHMNGIKIDL